MQTNLQQQTLFFLQSQLVEEHFVVSLPERIQSFKLEHGLKPSHSDRVCPLVFERGLIQFSKTYIECIRFLVGPFCDKKCLTLLRQIFWEPTSLTLNGPLFTDLRPSSKEYPRSIIVFTVSSKLFEVKGSLKFFWHGNLISKF